jgi:hypothetical protein
MGGDLYLQVNSPATDTVLSPELPSETISGRRSMNKSYRAEDRERQDGQAVLAQDPAKSTPPWINTRMRLDLRGVQQLQGATSREISR